MRHNSQSSGPGNNGLDAETPSQTSNPLRDQSIAIIDWSRFNAPPKPRCETLRASSADSTGEHAVACGALAAFTCAYCGPLCLACAEETQCFRRKHHVASEDDTPVTHSPKPLHRVAYFEVLCAACGPLRAAVELTVGPGAGSCCPCPACGVTVLWQFLAHGLTQRDLPFHERMDLPQDDDEGLRTASKRRLPWDSRPTHWRADDE
jgi:hypothetical protein